MEEVKVGGQEAVRGARACCERELGHVKRRSKMANSRVRANMSADEQEEKAIKTVKTASGLSCFERCLLQVQEPVALPAGAPGDEYRALSVKFLSTQFLQDVTVSVDDKVYDIEPRLRQLGKNTVCPRDQRMGAAYVDVATDANAGTANFMLSYTWGYRVHDIVASLVSFCERTGRRTEDVRVWICCLCVNQHRVKEMQAAGDKISFEAFASTFHGKVVKIGHVLSMLTPWDSPLYITRLWCIFELAMATEDPDVTITFVLPGDQEEKFEASLVQGSGLVSMSKIFENLGNVRVETAKASYDEDRRNILKKVAPGVDIDDAPALARACIAYNRTVVEQLQKWFIDCAFRSVRKQMEAGQLTATTQLVCGQVVQLANVLGSAHVAKAEPLVDTAVQVSKASGLVDNVPYCLILRNKGTILRYRKEYPKAMVIYDEVKSKMEALGETDSKDYADVLQVIAICYGAQGDYVKALEVAEQTKAGYIRAGLKDSADYANVVKSSGMTRFFQGDYSGAIAAYEESKRIFESIGKKNPWYYDLLLQMAKLHVQGSNIAEADALLQEAKVGLEGLGLLDGIHYRNVLAEIERIKPMS